MNMVRFAVGLLLLGLSAVPAGSWAGPKKILGPGAVVEVVREDAGGFDLRITLPAPTREVEVTGSDARFARVSLPGFRRETEAGRPAVPLRGFQFALPPGAAARVETEIVRSERFRDLPPLPAPTPRMTRGDGFPTPTADFLPDPRAYRMGVTSPALWASLGPENGWRFWRVQTLVVTPVRVDAGAGDYEAAREMLVRVRFEGAGVSSGALVPVTRDRPEFQSLADHMLINAASARGFRHRPRPSRGIMRGAQTDPAVRIRIGESGLARLTFAELAAAGLPAGLDVERVRLEERSFDARKADPYERTAIPRLVEDANENGVFDTGDHLVFYGLDFADRNPAANFSETRYSYFHTYWVTAGEGMEFAARNGSPPGAFTPVTSFPSKIRLEEERYYINFPPDATGGFMPLLPTVYWLGPFNDDADFSHEFRIPDPDLDGSCSFAANWQGAFLSGPTSTHRVSLEINGTRILDSRAFSNTQTLHWKSELLASEDLLQEGLNVLNVIGRGQSDDIIGSGAYLDFCEIVYDRRLAADGDALLWNSGVDTGDLEFTVSGFGSDAVLVLDVSGPVPVRITPVVQDDGGSFSIRIRETGVTSRRTYHACVLDGLEGLPPSPHELPPDLADRGLIGPGSTRDLIAEGESADYIFVTHPRFKEAFEPLVEHRREQGHRVLVCDVFEIYDQFAGGNKTPWAIQRMINLAFDTWEDAPVYLALGGDASEDYRNDTPDADPDWVPTMMHLASVPGALQIRELAATDPWFVSGAGPGDNFLDPVPDLFVGRLPVGSPEEATAVTNKILDYESMDPTDAWRNRGFFLADDEYSTQISGTSFYCWRPVETSFTRATVQLCEVLIPQIGGQTEFGCDMFLMSAYLDTVPELGRNPGNGDCPTDKQLATQDYVREHITPLVLKELSEGALIWSFTGHANKNQMTTEGLLMHRPRFSASSRDMDRVNNLGKPFIFHGFACHLAEFEHAAEGRNGESIGEVLLLAPNRGSIASVASTGYEWAYLNEDAQIAVTSPLFWDIPRDPETGRPQRILGPSTTCGLLTLAIETGRPDIQSMLRTYTLLGDPALRVDFAAPHFSVEVGGEPFEEGAALTAASLEDSLTITATISDDTDVSTIRVFDGDRELDPEELSLTNPTAGGTGRQLFELSFRTALRLDTYAVTIEAADWYGRANTFALPVVFGAEFFSSPTCFAAETHGDSRRMTSGGENRIESSEAVRAEIESPVPLEAGAFTLLLDSEPLADPAISGLDEEGRRWQIDAVRIWEEGQHQLTVRTETAGQAVDRSIGFTVSGEPLDLVQRPFCYPNPVEREGAALFYELTRGAREGEISIYTVSGRRVLRRAADCNAGKNRFTWNLRDDAGDEVANGVYLLVLDLDGFEGESVHHMERIAVTR